MARKFELTDAQSAHLLETVKRDLLPVIPTQLDLAPLLGVVQSRLSEFLDGQRGSFVIAFRVALLLGRSIESVLGIEEISQLVDPQQRRYPSRIFAARAAYLEGVPLKNIRFILTTSLRYDGDPGVRAWMKMMRSSVLVGPGSKEDTAWAMDLVRPGSKGIGKPKRKAVVVKGRKGRPS